MSQSTSSPDDAFKDSLNFVKKLWGGMGVPGMTTPSIPLPPMSPEELDKRIQELKSVETWLNMNAGMLRNTIQALEVQRATMAALQSMANTMQGVDGEKEGSATDFVNQTAVWWNTMQEQFKHAMNSALPTTKMEQPPTPTTKKTKSTPRKSTATRKTS